MRPSLPRRARGKAGRDKDVVLQAYARTIAPTPPVGKALSPSHRMAADVGLANTGMCVDGVVRTATVVD